MQNELDALETRLQQLIALTRQLRQENHQLRQDLARAESEARHQRDKVDQATARLERLLQQLPSEST